MSKKTHSCKDVEKDEARWKAKKTEQAANNFKLLWDKVLVLKMLLLYKSYKLCWKSGIAKCKLREATGN